jgi:DNA gyrase subunit A
MTARTGLGLVERLVLQTMADIDALPNRPYLKCARIAATARSVHGIHLDQAYATLCALAVDWLQSVPLVDGHGNLGSPDFGPAAYRYTEARLTPAGLLAVQSLRGAVPTLPFGLVLGDMYAGGEAPPFDPVRVLDALTLAVDLPGVDDRDLAAVVGPPVFPTGCAVDVDVAALHAGEHTRLRMSARITVEGGRLVVTNLPLGVGNNDVLMSVTGRSRPVEGADRHPDLTRATRLPIDAVSDVSDRRATRIVCTLREDADVDATIAQLLDLWPVSVGRPCRLDAPIARLVRQAVDGDPVRQLDAIARLRATLDDR